MGVKGSGRWVMGKVGGQEGKEEMIRLYFNLKNKENKNVNIYANIYDIQYAVLTCIH